jgi:hypothetical protein
MTQRNWFIFQEDHHIGPFSQEEIMSKIMLTQLNRDHLIWKEGSEDWLPVQDWPEFIPLYPVASDLPHNLSLGVDFNTPENMTPVVTPPIEEVIFHKEVEEEIEFEPPVELPPLPPLFTEIQKETVGEAGPPNIPPDLPPLPSLKSVPPSIPLPVDTEELPKVEPPRVELKEVLEKKTSIPKEKKTKEVVESDELKEIHVDARQEKPAPAKKFKIKSRQKGNLKSGELKRRDLKSEPIFDESTELETESLKDHSDIDSFQLSHIKFYLGLGLGLSGLLFFVIYLWNALQTTPTAYGLSKADREALLYTIDRPYEETIVYKIRPTQDLMSLWLGANYPVDGWAILRLKTKNERFLGGTPVELLTQGPYEKGMTYFNEIEILKGQSIVAGEYDYQLEIIPGDDLLKWKMLMKMIPGFGNLIDGINNNQEIKQLKGTILLSSLPTKQFEQKLENYQSRLDKNLIQPLKERKQRIETFLGLLEQMSELYFDTLKSIKKGSSIELFEDKYNKQIGPMMRDLIVDSHRRHLSLLNLNPKLSDAYQELTDFGKEVGELASYMATETKTYKVLDQKNAQEISGKIKTKYQDIYDKGLLMVDDLKDQLDSLQ